MDNGKVGPLGAGVDSVLQREQNNVGGTFPGGRLTPHDEGALSLAIGVRHGKVFIQFANPVGWLAMGADEAVNLAESLYRYGRKLGSTHIIDGDINAG